MVKDIKTTVYYELAYPALLEVVQGIFRLAEGENYLGEDGYFELPPYFRERIGKLREVIQKVHPPKTRTEMEDFLRCFDLGDYSPILRKRERELESYYIGARVYEREKARAKKKNSQTA